uniref:Uncharacterized protein n=1 Tax=Arcella intermedia TaxID=1963864 RepID=A0A6B2LQ65_9EUKA
MPLQQNHQPQPPLPLHQLPPQVSFTQKSFFQVTTLVLRDYLLFLPPPQRQSLSPLETLHLPLLLYP